LNFPAISNLNYPKNGTGPPGRSVGVTPFPGFAYPSGELQPGLLHEQALRAVCNLFCLLNRLGIFSTAYKRLCKQPGGPVHVIAQAEAPRRGKRSLGIASPQNTVPEGRHQSQLPFCRIMSSYSVIFLLAGCISQSISLQKKDLSCSMICIHLFYEDYHATSGQAPFIVRFS